MSGEDSQPATEQTRKTALKAQIQDLAEQVDSYKSRTAAALGASVFMLLVGIGAIYDIISAKSSLWSAVGISKDGIKWLAGFFTIGGGLLLVRGILRVLRRDRSQEARLAQMEEEYAELGDE